MLPGGKRGAGSQPSALVGRLANHPAVLPFLAAQFNSTLGEYFARHPRSSAAPFLPLPPHRRNCTRTLHLCTGRIRFAGRLVGKASEGHPDWSPPDKHPSGSCRGVPRLPFAHPDHGRCALIALRLGWRTLWDRLHWRYWRAGHSSHRRRDHPGRNRTAACRSVNPLPPLQAPSQMYNGRAGQTCSSPSGAQGGRI